jgi:hypothetical protein
MGSLVFRKFPTGETTMIKRADVSNVDGSPAQIENHQRMKQANSYARKALANPKVRAIYEKMAESSTSMPITWQYPMTTKARIAYQRNKLWSSRRFVICQYPGCIIHQSRLWNA